MAGGFVLFQFTLAYLGLPTPEAALGLALSLALGYVAPGLPFLGHLRLSTVLNYSRPFCTWKYLYSFLERYAKPEQGFEILWASQTIHHLLHLSPRQDPLLVHWLWTGATRSLRLASDAPDAARGSHRGSGTGCLSLAMGSRQVAQLLWALFSTLWKRGSLFQRTVYKLLQFMLGLRKAYSVTQCSKCPPIPQSQKQVTTFKELSF